MKIIHTADIHLDSPLTGVSDSQTRRTELLRAFSNMVDYAQNNSVEAIIVAGDLFDDQSVTKQTVATVAQIINGSAAQWFVLRGNHGTSAPYLELKQLCPQIKTFGEDWSYHTLGNVCICGRELGRNDAEHWKTFAPSDANYNVLVLHGDVDSDAYGVIDKKIIAASPVSYVALGHRHTLSTFKFGRVPACYCGVLEARGFDEPAETGFVVLDTETNKAKFVPQYIRRVETVRVDVSSVTTDLALEKLLLDSVSEVSPRNYLNVELLGMLNEGVRAQRVADDVLGGKYFALRIKNFTTAPYDLQKLQAELSLRGEFVKLALAIDDSAERAEVLDLGLRLLNGEV